MVNKTFTVAGLWLIVLVHIAGFISLREWLHFSGIGADAQRMERQYGYNSLVYLNLGAVIAFITIAMIFHNREKLRVLNYILMVIFVLRGVLGLILAALGITGTATVFWEIIFSGLALAIGMTGYATLEEER